MGAVAEVRKVAVGVDAEGVVLDSVDDFELEGLVVEEFIGLGAGDLGAPEGKVGGDGVGHLLFDGGKVFVSEGAWQIKVVVEAVLGGGADGELGLGEDGADGVGHDVGGGVSDGLAAKGEGVFLGGGFSGL